MMYLLCIRCGPTLAAGSFDLASDGTAWVMDVVGRLWFTTDVSVDKPEGSGLWWQVVLFCYLAIVDPRVGFLHLSLSSVILIH